MDDALAQSKSRLSTHIINGTTDSLYRGRLLTSRFRLESKMTDPILSVPPGGALSVKDFCRWSSLGRTAVYEEIGRGRLKARKVGRRTIILFNDARQWLDSLPTHEEALDEKDGPILEICLGE